uniref:Uncharacterized protein n=1 Tax=Chenopodium quinoa TaxID=63459 RepID=A0A803KZL4_CHEQI
MVGRSVMRNTPITMLQCLHHKHRRSGVLMVGLVKGFCWLLWYTRNSVSWLFLLQEWSIGELAKDHNMKVWKSPFSVANVTVERSSRLRQSGSCNFLGSDIL